LRAAHWRERRKRSPEAIRLIAKWERCIAGHFALEAAARMASALDDLRSAVRFQAASDAEVDKMGGTRTWFDDTALAALNERPRNVLGAEDLRSGLCGGTRPDAPMLRFAEVLAWLGKRHENPQ
jgi:hypothetical protein